MLRDILQRDHPPYPTTKNKQIKHKKISRKKIMILDKNRRWFIMTNKQKSVLQTFVRFRSPIDEESYYKGIDIQYLKLFKKEFKGMFRYRPRGGKYRIQNNCTMEDAKTFAVYHRDTPLPAKRYWVA